MNNFEILPRGLFIEMVRFAPGSQIPLIETGGGGREYALQNANTPRGTELVRGFLHALIIEDHFLYVSREVAMNRSEGFMEWLLAAKTGVATPNLALRFTPEVKIEELPSVDRMVLRPKEPADAGRRPQATAPVYADAQPAQTRAASERLAGESVFEILKAAHFTDERIAALEEQGVDIEIKIEVFFKSDGSRRELSRDDVADLIRDVPENEITLYSQAGREKAGHIRRVSFPAQVDTVGELFDRPSISGAMWEAYRYYTREGYIDR